MRLACLALTWSSALALAGKGDAATNAAPMRVAANGITMRCISLFSITSFSKPQNKRSPRLASQRPLSERTLLVDYDTRMGKTGRKIDGNWNSPRQVCFWGKPDVPDPLSNVC
jgi:hypothetical protein